MTAERNAQVVTGGLESLETGTSLGHVPEGRWAFDATVTAVFDDMLARSIPGIGTMRETVTRVATHFVRPGTCIVDLGCSLGTAMAPLVTAFGETNRFIGIEAAEGMVAACRERFQESIRGGIVEIHAGDVRDGFPPVEASVTLCVLTLMFTPIEYRYRVLEDVFAHTVVGGAVIVVEKILGSDGIADAMLTTLYHEHKRDMGYSAEAINRKRLSLEGVLVPVTAAFNEQLLRGAGFHQVECIWRCLNFCGWVAIKR